MARPQSASATRSERTGGSCATARLKIWFLAYLFFGFAISGLLAVQLPLIIASDGHRPFRVGAVIACQNGGIVLAPLLGWIADRLRAWKAVLVGGLALIGISFASLAVERSLNGLLVTGVLLGIGAGACNTMTILLVTRATPRDDWAVEFATLQMLGATGSVVGFAVAGLIGSRTGTLTAAGLSILAMVAATRAPAGDAGSPGSERAVASASHDSPLLCFAVFLTTWLLFSISVSGFSSFYPITMARNFGVGVAESSAVLALATLTSLPLYGAVGRHVRRSGAAGLLAAGVAGRASALVVLATLALVHDAPSVVAIGCAGVFQAIWPMIGVTSSELSARLVPRHEGVAIGVFQATGSVASAIGALLSGYVADRYGYQDVLGVTAAVAVAAVICGLGLCRVARTALPVSGGPAD